MKVLVTSVLYHCTFLICLPSFFHPPLFSLLPKDNIPPSAFCVIHTCVWHICVRENSWYLIVFPSLLAFSLSLFLFLSLLLALVFVCLKYRTLSFLMSPPWWQVLFRLHTPQVLESLGSGCSGLRPYCNVTAVLYRNKHGPTLPVPFAVWQATNTVLWVTS